MDLREFKALTMDCYGTLIDWETGIWNALQPLLSAGGLTIGREEALQTFGRFESDQQAATPSLRYSALLAVVHARLAAHWGVATQADLHDRFGGSVPDWPAFPDSAEALAYLARHFKLVILSNIDNASFAASRRKLGIAFDAVYTAEDIGSYKPSPRNFTYLLARADIDLKLAPDQILHVAQSLFHDHVPAAKAGLARCWIDRRAGLAGSGATAVPAEWPQPDFRFTSLGALAEAHRAAMT
ncbi:haloacid dehalogenase type II [Methyloraptor flagellatus]|uniref:Haloacid dehalogenase type II n=1 Tax=Methyloraptor flagellatus TaxID=3162530 RepID=A0AAU7XEC8_9HYPH